MFIMIEIKKPIRPRINIPIAETFAIVSYSFFVGFLKERQTLLHFAVKDFNSGNKFFILKIILRGF